MHAVDETSLNPATRPFQIEITPAVVEVSESRLWRWKTLASAVMAALFGFPVFEPATFTAAWIDVSHRLTFLRK